MLGDTRHNARRVVASIHAKPVHSHMRNKCLRWAVVMTEERPLHLITRNSVSWRAVVVTKERPAVAFAYQKQDVCAQEQQVYLEGTGEGVDGCGVQMIAGLIQQQQVAGNQSKSCQCHSGLLTPTQITCETGKTRKLVSC